MDTTLSSSPQIEGVTITNLGQICDTRGAVLQMIRCDSPEFFRFGECYFSEVVPGVVKGWKRHRCQTQNVAVPVGRVQMVIFDDRDHSTSFGELLIVELGRPDAYLRLKIPPGLWYAFSCLGRSPALLANCADLPHDPTDSEVRELNDPTFPYKWFSDGKVARGS